MGREKLNLLVQSVFTEGKQSNWETDLYSRVPLDLKLATGSTIINMGTVYFTKTNYRRPPLKTE